MITVLVPQLTHSTFKVYRFLAYSEMEKWYVQKNQMNREISSSLK